MAKKIVRWALLTVVAAALIAVVYKATDIPTDPYQQINTGTQLATMLLGAVVTLNEAWAQKNKHIVLAMFALIGFLGMYASSQQAKKSAADVADANRQRLLADTKLSKALEDLGRVTNDTVGTAKEIARIQNLNTQLQGRLLDQSKQIQSLATDISGEVTGKDTYCYIVISPNTGRGNPRTYDVLLFVEGKYPMRSVFATYYELVERNEQQTIQNFLNKQRIPLADTLIPGVFSLTGFRLGYGKFAITIQSRLITVEQTLNIEKSADQFGVRQFGEVRGGGKILHTIN